MEPVDWASIEREEIQIFDWLRELGLDKHHRLRIHRENIRNLIAARAENRYEELRDSLSVEAARERLWSICETIEFVDALTPLRGIHPPGIRRVLEETLQGPVDVFIESEKTNRGRNAAFELVVAGLYARAALPVEFCVNPDILSEFERRPVAIQCKRPFRNDTIRSNLFDAARQLREDHKRHPDALTVVAVSLSRIFHEGQRFPVFQSESDMDTGLRGSLRSVVDGLGRTVADLKRYGVSAILFHLNTPCSILSARMMTFRQVGVMTPVKATTGKVDLLQGIAKKVKMR